MTPRRWTHKKLLHQQRRRAVKSPALFTAKFCRLPSAFYTPRSLMLLELNPCKSSQLGAGCAILMKTEKLEIQNGHERRCQCCQARHEASWARDFRAIASLWLKHFLHIFTSLRFTIFWYRLIVGLFVPDAEKYFSAKLPSCWQLFHLQPKPVSKRKVLIRVSTQREFNVIALRCLSPCTYYVNAFVWHFHSASTQIIFPPTLFGGERRTF